MCLCVFVETGEWVFEIAGEDAKNGLEYKETGEVSKISKGVALLFVSCVGDEFNIGYIIKTAILSIF